MVNDAIKSWKSTAFGLIGAILTSLVDVLEKGVVDRKTIIMSAVIAGMGFLAKDFNSTHTEGK